MSRTLSVHLNRKDHSTKDEESSKLRAWDRVVFTGSIPNQAVLPAAMILSGLLERYPDGLALLDPDLQIIWCNQRLNELARHNQPVSGVTFIQYFPQLEPLGSELNPLELALEKNEIRQGRFTIGERLFIDLQAIPVGLRAEFQQEPANPSEEEETRFTRGLFVTLRDVSAEVLHQTKLNEIYRAGLELGDLHPDEIAEMSLEDRTELLKSRIVHYTLNLLNFESLEIRLLDPLSKELKPLLCVGMVEHAASRKLSALPGKENGITGLVASSGKSYLCPDTSTDPHYIEGAPGARCSLTVPLILNDNVQGTFNVENVKPFSLNENDRQCLELFGYEVAFALNTLQLLAVEQAATVNRSIDQIIGDIARPLDSIKFETTSLLEQGDLDAIQADPHLKKILRETELIQESIQEIRDQFSTAGEGIVPVSSRPYLKLKRILVVDGEEQNLRDARSLLVKYGSIIETTARGDRAISLTNMCDYHAIVVSLQLPDMSGLAFYKAILSIDPEIPVILTQQKGYWDREHVQRDCRLLGLKTLPVAKPFETEQLCDRLEDIFKSQKEPL